MRIRQWLMAGGLAALLLLTAAWPVMAETEFTQVPGLSRIKAVAAAGDRYAALRADGTVWTWVADADADGLGDIAPRQVSISCPVREVAVGAEHLAMLCADGTVWTAGIAIDEPGVHRAVQVPGLGGVKAVNLGKPHLYAVKTDGTVWTGELPGNAQGAVRRMEQVPDLTGVVAIAAGVDDFVALTADGRVAWMAINTKGTGAKRMAEVPPVRSVAVCGPGGDCDDTDEYLFTTFDGQVLAWSVGADGVERSVAVGQSVCNPCVAAGHGRALFVTSGGAVRTALLSADGTVSMSETGRPGAAFTQVAAGQDYEVGRTANGLVYHWRVVQRPSQVEGLSEIKAIASGADWHLALGGDGRLMCWDSSDENRRTHVIPHVFEVRGIAAADDYFVTLNADGSVAAGQCPAPGAVSREPIVHRDIAARSAAVGRGHVIIIKFDGGLEVAGIAIDETGVHFGNFAPVAGLAGVVQAAAGDDGYLALLADGTVWGARWGSAPARVQDLAGARAVAAGDTSFAVLLGDGSVRGIAIDEEGLHIWGDPHVDESDGIAAGDGPGGGGSGGAVVVRADGTVVTFSRTVGAGQVTEILDIIAVSSGATEHLALRADGTVWRWSR